MRTAAPLAAPPDPSRPRTVPALHISQVRSRPRAALCVPRHVLDTLFCLGHDQTIATIDLGQRFACEASCTTGLVVGLEEQGVSTRQARPPDRRVRTVVLSETRALDCAAAHEVM